MKALMEGSMAKTLIVYATRTGNTTDIGKHIGEGVRMAGAEAKIASTEDVKNEGDLEGYDAYVFGSATYHSDMLEDMVTFLKLAEKVPLEGKIGGSFGAFCWYGDIGEEVKRVPSAFGAFGWSGEAPDRIYSTMKDILKMDMVDGPLRLRSVQLGGGIKMAQDYGREIAKKLGH
jgi:flavorubredoxin